MSLFTLAQESPFNTHVDTGKTIFDRVLKVTKRQMMVLEYFFLTIDTICVQGGEVGSRQTHGKTYSECY